MKKILCKSAYLKCRILVFVEKSLQKLRLRVGVPDLIENPQAIVAGHFDIVETHLLHGDGLPAQGVSVFGLSVNDVVHSLSLLH